MILTAEQAAAICECRSCLYGATTHIEAFVVDGVQEDDWPSDGLPPAMWDDLDKPCPTCGGGPLFYPEGEGPTDAALCPDCHGTGRHVEELVTTAPLWADQPRGEQRSVPLGLFTVQVLPIEDDPRMIAGMVAGALRTQDVRDMGLDAQPGQFAVICTKVET